jgi:hypothetical protein
MLVSNQKMGADGVTSFQQFASVYSERIKVTAVLQGLGAAEITS